MNKAKYVSKLSELLLSMIGEKVTHFNLGLGTIVDVRDGKCIVKYETHETNKQFLIESFFDYNDPVSELFRDEFNNIRCEYELSKKVKDKTKKNFLEYVKDKEEVKKITFDDIVGLDDLKDTINNMVVYPLKYKEIYKAFNRHSGGGILLYGPPGNGKTLIAKAIANEIDAKFFPIKCSSIASKWYGESERKIKELFEDAKSYERSIIYFDEFDSLGTSREDESNQASNRVVSELLAQLDGFDAISNTVLVIASTNKPWSIDSALLRSGRFNKKIYVGLPDNVSRHDLLIHELFGVPTKEIDYDEISLRCAGYSCADIVEVVNEAKDLAIKRSIKGNSISPVTHDDLLSALSSVHSTIVKSELERLSNFKLR